MDYLTYLGVDAVVLRSIMEYSSEEGYLGVTNFTNIDPKVRPSDNNNKYIINNLNVVINLMVIHIVVLYSYYFVVLLLSLA